jgi:hypothetical protein
MAHRKEIITKRVIYSIPTNSALDEVGKAIQDARRECAELKGVAIKDLYDDDVRIASHDEEVHFYFEVEVKP